MLTETLKFAQKTFPDFSLLLSDIRLNNGYRSNYPYGELHKTRV